MKNIIDYHCHVAGIGYGSGCFISKKLLHSYKFIYYLRALGVTKKELKEFGDSLVIERLSRKILDSKYVSHAVVLAMDGVVRDGELDMEQTEMYIPNDYLLEELKKYPNLLFGASINPFKSDSLKLLEWVKENGAVLIKWIPSIMQVDPSNKKIVSFYEKMVELDLPLLTHTGQERSFTGAHDHFCDPLKIELPLKIGVKVIAAHIATTGKSEGQDNFERILSLFDKYPNLYADISSLTQINKLGYLKKALKVACLKNRLIYGTDWPLQSFPVVSPFWHFKHLSLKQMFEISKIENKWDRDVLLKKALGVSDDIFCLRI